MPQWLTEARPFRPTQGSEVEDELVWTGTKVAALIELLSAFDKDSRSGYKRSRVAVDPTGFVP